MKIVTPPTPQRERYSIQLTAPLNPPNTLLLNSPPNLPPLVVFYSGVSLDNLVVFGTVFVRNGFRFAVLTSLNPKPGHSSGFSSSPSLSLV